MKYTYPLAPYNLGKLTLIILFLLLFFQSARAQNTTDDISKAYYTSPEVSNLGKYGQIPVDLYNGTYNLSIPLYEIKERGVSVPITISYNSGGNKVGIAPTMTGIGWSISAGGAISRTINGAPDESIGAYLEYVNDNEHHIYNILPKGYWHARNRLASSNWYDSSNLYDPVGEYFVDKNPDEFNFNFNGISGSFYMDHNGIWKIKSKQSQYLKIDCQITNEPPTSDGLTQLPVTFYKFTITDEKGIQYVFGGDMNMMDFGDGGLDGVTYFDATYNGVLYNNPYTQYGVVTSYPTAWYLKEIITQSGEKISFQYDKKTEYFLAPIYEGIYGSGIHLGAIPTRMVFFSPSQISKIVTPNQTVNFTLEKSNSSLNNSLIKVSGLYKLTDIKVIKDNIELKDITLNYIDNVNERLKLKNIVYKTSFGNYNYAFTYNPLVLPDYTSQQTDHWGYYNGKTPPNISTDPSFPTNFYNSKEANNTYAQAELLTSVQYPIGGKSTFYYEPNTYAKVAKQYPFTVDNISGIGGGVRISKIISDPVTGTPEVKEYFYTSNSFNATGTSSGVLSGIPVYYIPTQGSVASFFQNKMLNTLGSTYGKDVTYTRVVEKANSGFTVYNFSNHDNGYADVPALTTGPGSSFLLCSRELERGNLLSVEKTMDNVNHDLVYKTENYYNDDPARYNDFVRAIGGSPNGGTVAGSSLGIAAITYYTFTPYLKKTVETSYHSNGNVSIVNEYSYDNTYKKIKQIKTTNSNGDELYTYFRYPFDVINYAPAANANATSAPYAFMKEKNIIGNPIETVKTIKTNGVETIRNVNLTTYKGLNITLPDNSTIQTVVPNTDYLAKSTPMLKSSYSNFVVNLSNGTEQEAVSSTVEPNILYSKYDNVGNITELKNSDIQAVNQGFNSIAWGYNKRYMIANIKDAKRETVSHTSFEEKLADIYDTDDWQILPALLPNNGTNLATKSNSYVTGGKTGKYSCNASLITSKTFPLSSCIVTLWAKGSGTIQVNNVAQTISGDWKLYTWNVSSTTQVTINNPNGLTIDELRLFPANAQVTTYTYDPLVGVTSVTDTKNLITYYEYDDFQRLMNVKNKDGHIIKNYLYYTTNQSGVPPVVFYSNVAKSISLQPVCGSGYTPGPTVTYLVPAGLYTSSISQADADNQAQTDLNNNGQNYANTYGTCTVQSGNASITLRTNTSLGSTGYRLVINDTGQSFTFPASGTATFSVTSGTYNSVSIAPVGQPSSSHTFTMGSGMRASITGTSATFNTVNFTNGAADTNISIN